MAARQTLFLVLAGLAFGLTPLACASAGAGDTGDDTGDDAPGAPDASVAPDATSIADASPPADAPPPPPPDAAPPCLGGNATVTDPATGHCYVRVDPSASWEAARSGCQALGPGHHLVALSSGAENDLVESLAGPATVWIGANDRATEMQFTWSDATEPFSFTKWASGEPNDDGTEDCAVLVGDNNGKWSDTECGGNRPYVCERP